MEVINARVILRLDCDPAEPGQCAPEVELVEGSEADRLMVADSIREHGVRVSLAPVEGNPDEQLLEELDAQMEEAPVSQETEDLVCPLEPDVPWEDSACQVLEDQLTERVMARVLGGDGNG